MILWLASCLDGTVLRSTDSSEQGGRKREAHKQIESIYIGRRFFDGQRREAIEGNRTQGELLQKRWRQVSQHRSVDDSIDDYLYKEACDFYYIRQLPYKEGVNMTLV